LIGILPNLVIYTTLLSSISKQHKCPEALELFDRVISLGFIPDQAFFEALLISMYLKGVDINLKNNRVALIWAHLKDNYSTNKVVMNEVCLSLFSEQLFYFLDIG
jgi:pentatricopeptide repeat protein